MHSFLSPHFNSLHLNLMVEIKAKVNVIKRQGNVIKDKYDFWTMKYFLFQNYLVYNGQPWHFYFFFGQSFLSEEFLIITAHRFTNQNYVLEFYLLILLTHNADRTVNVSSAEGEIQFKMLWLKRKSIIKKINVFLLLILKFINKKMQLSNKQTISKCGYRKSIFNRFFSFNKA